MLFKEKEIQLKNEHEIERDKLRNERDGLKERAERAENELGQLKREVVGDSAENESQRMADYQNKLSALNLEIALTENIY